MPKSLRGRSNSDMHHGLALIIYVLMIYVSQQPGANIEDKMVVSKGN